MKSLLMAFVLSLIGIKANAETLNYANQIVAETTWEKGPQVSEQVSEESIMRIEWKNIADNSTFDPIEFEVILLMDMPDMKHGSAPTQIHKLSPGVYQVTGMYFTMGGKWDVQVVLKTQEGKTETQVIPVMLKGGHHHH